MRLFLIKAYLACSALLPLRLSHVIGIIAGLILRIFPNKTRHIANTNIQLCFPELNRGAHKRLLNNTLIETGKTALEMGALWFWSKPRVLSLIKHVTGQDKLDNALHNRTGVILAIPHLGSWEMVGLYCSNKYPMTSMYRMPRIASMDMLMRQARERFGATLVPATAGGIRSLYKALTNNELVAILPDQEPSRGSGVFMPFFGIPAYTMTLLPKLARSSGAIVIFAFAERLSRGCGFHLHFVEAHPDVYSENMTLAITAMNQGVEQCIKMLPEQYQWGYKRFRTRPSGEQEIY